MPLEPQKFRRPGTVEFVVAEAGLVNAEADTLQPTEALNGLFTGGTAPDLEHVLPPLMDFVRGLSYDHSKLGLSGKELRMAAGHELRALGMTNQGLAGIEQTLLEGGARAQERLEEVMRMSR